MIFQHTWQKVLAGQKTQTRRLVKREPLYIVSPGTTYNRDVFIDSCSAHSDTDKPFPGVGVYRCKGTQGGWLTGDVAMEPEWTFCAKWIIGRTYAVQPGRGQKQVGRILLTGIRREDVRTISTEDAQSEGFYTPLHFLRTWASMHDKAFPETEYLADSVDRYLDRPAHLYDAWVLEFALVEAA